MSDFDIQRVRVLRALVKAGDEGITQHEFRIGARAIDGGPPIARLASRIVDLRKDGYQIKAGGWRKGVLVYRLADPGTAPEPPAALFEDEDAA